MPNCFIIMPLTTRAELVSQYDGDTDHFIHVLEHFLVPSVQAAGFEPVRPIAEGSEIVHARIISKLTDADMVLCDMSGLNPNVFFELGIRTALNKPTCIIKDDLTHPVPFDTNIINYHMYASKLSLWNIEAEKSKLAEHIKKSVDAEKPGNAMWRLFGLDHAAHLAPTKPGEDARYEYLTVKIDQLFDQLLKRDEQPELNLVESAKISSTGSAQAIEFLRQLLTTGYPEERLAVALNISLKSLREILKTGKYLSPQFQKRVFTLWDKMATVKLTPMRLPDETGQ